MILLNSLCTITEALVINVDPGNEIEDHRCWTGGISLPCKDYELAKEGALYLTYVKLLNATLDILLPVKVFYINPKIPGYTDSWYVYYDASYKYFSKEHLPYALISSLLFLVFGLSPLVLLIVYPMSCFQRYCYGASNYALRTFVDAFQGHYKDGTEPGTRDSRWFAGIYFLGRIMILYVVFGAVKYGIGYTFVGFIFLAMGMLIILLQPFKSTKVNTYITHYYYLLWQLAALPLH